MKLIVTQISGSEMESVEQGDVVEVQFISKIFK